MKNKMAFIAFILGLAVSAQAGPYDTWSKYRVITVNTTAANGGANVAGSVTNFPVLVRLTSDSAATGADVLSGALANGEDIRFTDSTGNTALSYEIEKWGTTAAAIWVKVPAIAGNATTPLRLYWGKSSQITASNGTAVFDTADGFRGVYHLGEAAGDSARDATALHYDLEAGTVNSVVPQDTIGIAGTAKNFVGGGANGNAIGGYYRRLAADAPRTNWNGENAQFTLSLWVFADSIQGTATTNRRGILGRYATTPSANQGYVLATIQTPADPATTVRFQGAARNVTATSGTNNGSYRGGDAPVRQWHHIAYSRSGTAGTASEFYINGVSITGSTGTATTGNEGTGWTTPQNFVIGGYSDLMRFWNGKMDEVRIDSTARSADWVKLSYETQKAATGAVTLGATQTQSVVTVPGAPTGVTGTPGNAQVTVAWIAPASNGGAAITGYKAMAVSDTTKSCTTTGALTCVVTGLTNDTAYTFIVKASNSAGNGAASVASAVVTPAAPGGYSAWTQNRAIVLNTSAAGANVSGTVLNFPVLVRLTSTESSIFTQAKAAGADIRFSKSNGTTALPYQIERWDATAKTAEIWVRVDTVLGNNSSQSIKMYWGNSAATSESSGPSTFPDAGGFRAVYHLNDANDSTARDATANGYHAVPGNVGATNPASVAGAIGIAKNFAGLGGTSSTGSYYKVANTNTAAPRLNFNTAGDSYTLSAWIRSDALPAVGTAGRQGILAKYGSATNQQYVMGLWGSASGTGATCATAHKMNATGGRYQEAADCAANPGVWTHITATRAGTGNNSVELYVNGEVAGTEGAEGATNYSTTSDLIIGAFSDTTRFFDGAIDEIRLDSTARSADYIKLSYESQKANQAFTNIGLLIVTVPGAPQTVTVAPGNSQVTVAWLAPVSNGGGTITGYKAMAVSDTAKSCTTTGALTCVVTGLTNGTAYTFVVKASNSAGTGAASTASAPVTPGPTALHPGPFLLRVNGSEKPYTFQLPANLVSGTEKVTLSIADVWGRVVWSKSIRPSTTQIREIAWNGKASNGTQASAGMYIVRLSILNGGKTTHLMEKSVTLKP